jgi:hypothetical protein
MTGHKGEADSRGTRSSAAIAMQRRSPFERSGSVPKRSDEERYVRSLDDPSLRKHLNNRVPISLAADKR